MWSTEEKIWAAVAIIFFILFVIGVIIGCKETAGMHEECVETKQVMRTRCVTIISAFPSCTTEYEDICTKYEWVKD